ncbi:AAA family ATPase [Pyrococcus abyssi]|uniref:Archaeal ATPase n=1 Tax=Pyrococcus abyssi (strain GE5 / Orsay) TaxID=272844 RepID=Q9UZH8_PYRAB|nr:ATP-binding protein [Pyrococcus abyssi]CAB50079.1 Hypothetical protein, containing ATP/GTP-binding site motif A [Pyrococcus abyssi GE5]CCE70592.1 TPA: Archaeal ATPase [Pyrococcus abyssi GE5]
MLFDPKPKERKEDLFDREEELAELISSITKYPITLLLGIRRTGKSSIIKVSLNEIDAIGIYIDVRKAMKGGRVSEERLKLQLLGNIRRLRINIPGIKLEPTPLDMTDIFDLLNSYGRKRRKIIVLAFDEAQYFRFYGSRGGEDFLLAVAYSYDNHEWIRFLFSGSEVGLLHDFLGFDDSKAPLFGRIYNEITLEPFPRDLSIEFLREGFREVNLNVPQEHIEVAVDELDGVPGWLVEYGYHYVHTRDHREALERTLQNALSLIRSELSELERRSERYVAILKAISLGINRWSKIKEYVEAKHGSITNARFSALLKNLEKMSWIRAELKDGRKVYRIVDPVVERVIRSL